MWPTSILAFQLWPLSLFLGHFSHLDTAQQQMQERCKKGLLSLALSERGHPIAQASISTRERERSLPGKGESQASFCERRRTNIATEEREKENKSASFVESLSRSTQAGPLLLLLLYPGPSRKSRPMPEMVLHHLPTNLHTSIFSSQMVPGKVNRGNPLNGLKTSWRKGKRSSGYGVQFC